MADHVEECPHRLTSCQYCLIEGEYQFIEGSHKEQCDKFPVPCPNKCELTNIPRQDLQEHRTVCPLEIVHCQYHDVGCEAEIARKDLATHDEENTNKHLLLMKSILIDTQNKLSVTQSKLADTSNKLVGTQNKLSETQNQLRTTSLELAVAKLNLSDKLTSTNDKLTSTNDRLTSTNDRLTSTKDKLTNTNQRMNSAEKKLKDHAEILDKIILVQNRVDELDTALKQKTKLFDNLFGKWTINIHTKAAQLSSCEEEFPVIVKMPEFMKYMTNKFEWYSDPFYTAPMGYQMQLMVVAAGRGSGEGWCMSVYLCIMDGPYDYLLKWKLRGKFQVTLLNQISNSMHRSASYKVYANRDQSRYFWHCEELISHADLFRSSADCQFLKDNSVFFEVCEL